MLQFPYVSVTCVLLMNRSFSFLNERGLFYFTRKTRISESMFYNTFHSIWSLYFFYWRHWTRINLIPNVSPQLRCSSPQLDFYPWVEICSRRIISGLHSCVTKILVFPGTVFWLYSLVIFFPENCKRVPVGVFFFLFFCPRRKVQITR